MSNLHSKSALKNYSESKWLSECRNVALEIFPAYGQVLTTDTGDFAIPSTAYVRVRVYSFPLTRRWANTLKAITFFAFIMKNHHLLPPHFLSYWYFWWGTERNFFFCTGLIIRRCHGINHVRSIDFYQIPPVFQVYLVYAFRKYKTVWIWNCNTIWYTEQNINRRISVTPRCYFTTRGYAYCCKWKDSVSFRYGSPLMVLCSLVTVKPNRA